MIELYNAAKQLADFFQRHKWDYAFIGGLAVLRWGDIRMTTDVDATLLTRYVAEDDCIRTILNEFEPRIADAAAFAAKNRVVLVKTAGGISLDISLGVLLFEERVVERSSLYSFTDEYTLRTCSAEDLIVFKAFAARDKDWADVASILARQRGKLDVGYILEQLAPLCEMKEEPEIVERFKKMMDQHA